MCGIFAALGEDGSVRDEIMRTALGALGHRGPDGSRHWISASRNLGVGQTRLAVVDLHTGDQPLANEDETIQVVVNGEFYDHRRIRRTLEQSGHRFRSRSDSEVVLHLWEEHGIECLDHLNGEFAFALWDESRRVLFAARDRFGVKPLYYAQHAGFLYLASEAKALFKVGVPARWDRESFFELCHYYYSQGRTLFADVLQVPPGHYILAGPKGFVLRKYWDLDYPERDAAQAPRSPGEHVALLRRALEEAVDLRLQADVPVACYLSGGLDSSAVLGVASRRAASPVHAFTITFDADGHDESSAAAETARFTGAVHHLVAVSADDICDRFEDAVWHSETVNPDTNGVAKNILSQHVRDAGFKVVLTGEGGDEVAAGYDFLVRDAAMQRGTGTLRRERNLAQLSGPGLPNGEDGVSTASIREKLGFVPSWIQWFAEAAAHSRSLWSAPFTTEFAKRDPYRSFLEGLDCDGQLAGREPVNQALYLWNKSMFPNLLLNQLADRAEMAHGVEGRLPLLDNTVVALLRDMPVSMKIRSMSGKHILREAARPYLTESTYRRRKKAFLAPPPTLTKGDRLSDLLQDLLRSPEMAAVPFFDHRAIIRFLDLLPSVRERQPRMAAELGKQLVYLASACVLQKRFSIAS